MKNSRAGALLSGRRRLNAFPKKNSYSKSPIGFSIN
ncbi:hypothetical protein P872_25320 [Rhodonellum psychrophilum GCM71 = DSM 17998]|uniref:Uncharacterized protein n=1 Tax=Rhodonellum psychrophilum GCM71 = DSM 17998 TaxID=1123057 RepID=U5BV14_9BACT|nr:hypothetical protein P872_25320 [Rhodonellum psychrophilum GCM71 = DSM 17998]